MSDDRIYHSRVARLECLRLTVTQAAPLKHGYQDILKAAEKFLEFVTKVEDDKDDK